MEEQKKNPWLGLESYKEGEVLYGRDDDIRDLTQSVLNDTDTLLYGKSGIGKSSILNAGILPAARRNGFVPVIVRLSHKGDTSYLKQITNNIVNSVTPPLEIREVVASKDIEFESLYEFFHRNMFFTANGERVKLLVIFDQFEEIFTLQSDEAVKKRFFAELADLLNDIMPANLQQSTEAHIEESQQATLESSDDFDALFNDIDLGDKNDILDYVTDNEIHLVFTIREDFLSEFEYYTASIPSLKQNRYGLRPINEEQAAQIILRPMPGLIDASVAKLIIEKVTGRTDFELDGIPEIEVDSAVLSLYLNRLYDAKTGDIITSELVEQKGGEIIADFYIDAISEISESTVEYLEDMLLNGNGRRDNITVFDAIHDGGATEQELDILCNKKKILRLFNYAGDLRIEYVHDILCPVVKSHKDERIQIKRQEEERQRQEEEKQKILLEEKAKRELIEREAEEEKNRLKAEAIQARKRNRHRLFLFIVAFFLLFSAGMTYYLLAIKEFRTSYLQFEIINGWPQGTIQLDKETAKRQPIYYDLVKKGYLGKYTDIEIKSFCPELPKQPRVDIFMTANYPENDKNGKCFYDLLCQAERIHFTEGEEGKIDKEIVYGRNNRILFVASYFHLNKTESWIHFLSNKGRALQLRDNRIDRVKLSTDSIGRMVSLMFYDQTGKTDIIDTRTSGFYWRYVNDTTYQINLNIFGLPVQDEWNTLITSRFNDTLVTQYGKVAHVLDEKIPEARGPLGYVCQKKIGEKEYFYEDSHQFPVAVRTTIYNKNGQILKESMDGSTRVSIPAIVKYTYQPHTGFMLSKEMYNSNGQRFDDKKHHIYKYTWDYNSQGLLTESSQYDIYNKRRYYYRYIANETVSRSVVDDQRTDISLYTERIDSVINNKHIIIFFDKGHIPQNQTFIVLSDTLKVHRIEIEGNGLDSIWRFWVYDNDNASIRRAVTSCNDKGFYNSYYCLKASYDNNGNCKSFQKIDDKDNIIKSMKFYIQNGEIIGRSAMSLNGDAVRCPKWEEDGYTYYKMYYSKNFNDQFVNLVGVNEWDERSTFGDGIQSLIVDYHDFISWSMVKKGQMPIVINQHFYQQVFIEDPKGSSYRIPYVHFHKYNTEIERQGLSDGDRLVMVGSWHIGQSESLLEKAWNQLDNGKEVHIVCYKYASNGLTKRELTLKGSSEATKSVTFHFAPLSNSELTNWNKIYK